MDDQNLIRMANRIGDFFDAMPDRAEALDGVATHVRKFWEPRMRRRIYQLIDDGRADDLGVLVQDALLQRRDDLIPRG